MTSTRGALRHCEHETLSVRVPVIHERPAPRGKALPRFESKRRVVAIVPRVIPTLTAFVDGFTFGNRRWGSVEQGAILRKKIADAFSAVTPCCLRRRAVRPCASPRD